MKEPKQNSISKLKNHPASEINEWVIGKFKDYCLARGFDHKKAQRCVLRIRNISNWLEPDFCKLTSSDMLEIKARVEKSQDDDALKKRYKATLDIFCKFLKQKRILKIDRIESSIKNIKISSISERNKELILQFKDECFATGLGKLRVLKYLYSTRKLAEWLNVDFDKATKANIKTLVAEIEKSSYSENSKHDFEVAIKKFYKWLKGDENTYPEEVRWLKTTMKNSKIKIPEDLIMENEVKDLVNAAECERDRAFVFLLYESGCRIGELLGLKLKNIQKDEYGFILIVKGKTGMRRVRIVSASPHLALWMNIHPKRNDPESDLWASKNKNMDKITYNRLRYILRELKNKTGLKKAVNPHNFRHSRATYLANYLTESQMCEYFGWKQGSDMTSVYVHLSGRDVDGAILKTHGIITNESEKEVSQLTPAYCSRCKEANPSSNKFCNKCGMTLDEKAAANILQNEIERQKADDIMDEVIEDQEVKDLLDRKIKALMERKMQVLSEKKANALEKGEKMNG